jgi:hypothetical protein
MNFAKATADDQKRSAGRFSIEAASLLLMAGAQAITRLPNWALPMSSCQPTCFNVRSQLARRMRTDDPLLGAGKSEIAVRIL